MKTNRKDLTFLRLADFQDLEAERARSSQLETQRQELEAPSIPLIRHFLLIFDLGIVFAGHFWYGGGWG